MKHRHNLEDRYQELDNFYVKESINHSLLGTWLGFIVALAVLVLAGYFAFLGYAKTGASLAIAVIVGLVGTFVYGTTYKENNIKQQ